MTETELLDQAFEYTFPYVTMGRLRAVTLGDGRKPGRIALNAWNHRRNLAGPRDRRVTTPNADTAYSILWTDLASGPIVLSAPDTDERYYSLAFLNMATDNFAMIGRRVSGTRAERFVLVGPDWDRPLPRDIKVIRAPNNDVVVLCRILVNGDADLPAVNALQDAFTVEPLGTVSNKVWDREIEIGEGPQPFVNLANAMLARNPPPRYERALLERFCEVGICGTGRLWEDLADDTKALWRERWPSLLGSLTGGLLGIGPVVNGWRYSKANLGNFGTDYTYRAQVALDGLLALEPAEATYPSTRTDAENQPLNGAHRYQLSLPAGVPQVNAFWSLSMYQKEPDGMLFFASNSINRYAIGDRTPGLKRGADGSLTISIQHEEPAYAAERTNWLPAPSGDFHIVFRAYEPKAAFREGREPLPAVARL
jgi:hypothetical protein